MKFKPHPVLRGEEIEVKEWHELSIDEKADFCSKHKIGFLSKHPEFGNEHIVKALYNKENGIE